MMDCDACGYEWAAVHPVVCEYLECPVCHHMTPAPFVEGTECEAGEKTPMAKKTSGQQNKQSEKSSLSKCRHNMTKLKLTLMKWWCVMMHRSSHENYWNELSKRFFRCKKCGVNHAKHQVV